MIKKLSSLIKATLKQVKAGCPIASEEEQEMRVSTCASCELLQKYNFTCGSCGCYLQYKIPWETSECPEGKW